MQCFASNAAVDPTLIRVRGPGFGTPIGSCEVATVRALLSADEAEHRLGHLFTRFVEKIRREHARGEMVTAHHWALQSSTQIHSNLALSLRIFRELLPQAFLMTLFGPSDPDHASPYLFNGLEELRGIDGNLVFTGTALVCELEAKTENVAGPRVASGASPQTHDHAEPCSPAQGPEERSQTDSPIRATRSSGA